MIMVLSSSSLSLWPLLLLLTLQWSSLCGGGRFVIEAVVFAAVVVRPSSTEPSFPRHRSPGALVWSFRDPDAVKKKLIDEELEKLRVGVEKRTTHSASHLVIRVCDTFDSYTLVNPLPISYYVLQDVLTSVLILLIICALVPERRPGFRRMLAFISNLLPSGR
jgi:hypothetical protein